MNLVAKEFVAARDDERGVLVLSQFTGAARELSEALIVNPYDIEQCAAALRVALTMPPDEQRDRMRSMRSLIQEFNVYRWAGRMLLDAARMRNRRRVAGPRDARQSDRPAARMTTRRMPPFAADWAFFLDIDGTLLEYAAHPQEVRVESDAAATAGGGCARRRRRAGADQRPLGAGHRHAVRAARVSRRPASTAPSAAPPTARCAGTRRRSTALGRAAAEIVRLTAAHSGLVFENKGMTLALHYRLAPGAANRSRSAKCAPSPPAWATHSSCRLGKMVVEIRPSGKDKGIAIAEFLAEAPFAGRAPVFIGDDLTDEPGFEVVNRARRPLGEGRCRHHRRPLAAARCRRGAALAG